MRHLLSSFLIAFLLLPGLTVDAVSLACSVSDTGVMPVEGCCCAMADQPDSCDAAHMQPACCCDVQVAYRFDERPAATILTKFSLPDASPAGLFHILTALETSTDLSVSSSRSFVLDAFCSSRLSPHALRALLCTYRI